MAPITSGVYHIFLVGTGEALCIFPDAGPPTDRPASLSGDLHNPTLGINWNISAAGDNEFILSMGGRNLTHVDENVIAAHPHRPAQQNWELRGAVNGLYLIKVPGKDLVVTKVDDPGYQLKCLPITGEYNQLWIMDKQ